MQQNQESLDIFVVSHPVAHCTRYRAQWADFLVIKIYYSQSCERER